MSEVQDLANKIVALTNSYSRALRYLGPKRDLHLADFSDLIAITNEDDVAALLAELKDIRLQGIIWQIVGLGAAIDAAWAAAPLPTPTPTPPPPPPVPPTPPAPTHVRPTGDFVPTIYLSDGTTRPCDADVDNAVRDAVEKYNLPRWYYYATIARETYFDKSGVNANDGGKGLVQLTYSTHQGMPYPQNLATPDNTNQQWIWDVGLNRGEPFVRNGVGWIDMSNVTRLDDPFNPSENLNRWSTVYAAPAFYMMKRLYNLSDSETLKAMAYHYNRGLPYDSTRFYNPAEPYLIQWDAYVALYKPPCEAQDGVWDGKPNVAG